MSNPAESQPPGAQPDDPTERPKSLWGLMGRSGEPADADSDVELDMQATPPAGTAHAPAEGDDDDAQRPRGLWAVMQTQAHADAESAAFDADSQADESDTGEPESADAVWELPGVEIGDEPPARHRSRRTQAARRPTGGVIGAVSVLLSLLALWPGWWMSLPALLTGFAAFTFGVMSLTERRRSPSQRRSRRRGLLGVSLGLAGIFLGPFVFAELGRERQSDQDRAWTRGHLETIGSGLLGHHAAHGRFPQAGVFRVEEQGQPLASHSWLTHILPFIGREQLYAAVDLQQAYDAPANAPAMRTDVEAYFAAGADPSKTSRGLAVAHFAGLGGQIASERGDLVHVGIFDDEIEVRTEDIRDGASQTLVVGEIAYAFPAWGEPENWRQIGRGLNRDVSGFGNAAGTGALFLHADGSVKFYGNGTSPEVLRKMSTRDGDD